jgi:molybdenum-dependent DNA-binding transcriptional regulator ModE
MARKSIIRERARKEGKNVPDLILQALNNKNTAQEAAKDLGVAYRTLWGYMKRYNIQKVERYEIGVCND